MLTIAWHRLPGQGVTVATSPRCLELFRFREISRLRLSQPSQRSREPRLRSEKLIGIGFAESACSEKSVVRRIWVQHKTCKAAVHRCARSMPQIIVEHLSPEGSRWIWYEGGLKSWKLGKFSFRSCLSLGNIPMSDPLSSHTSFKSRYYLSLDITPPYIYIHYFYYFVVWRYFPGWKRSVHPDNYACSSLIRIISPPSQLDNATSIHLSIMETSTQISTSTQLIIYILFVALPIW